MTPSRINEQRGRWAVVAMIDAKMKIYNVIFSLSRWGREVPANPTCMMDHQLCNTTTHCCADCGVEGGISLKACKSCMLVKYCNANCQRNHWPKHKTTCKERAAELHDEALFKDPPAMEDCPICFLPMPSLLVCSVSLPPATISSVPIYDFATANAALAQLDTEQYYECPTERMITDKERVKEMMKRVEANDAGAMSFMGSYYYHGSVSLLQDQKKAMELWKQAGALGSSHAHFCTRRWQGMKWQDTTLDSQSIRPVRRSGL